MDLKNKIIIVTGGNGLLGKEMLLNIRENGGIAINADLSCNTDLSNYQVKLDVTKEDSIDFMLYEVNKRFGKIDGIVNNAYPRTNDFGAYFEELSTESWKKNVDMQLNSVFVCIKKIIPFLRESHGSVVNIGSIYGIVGNDFDIYKGTDLKTAPAYSAIKGGIINFTRYLASYYGKENIRFNVVSPGGIFDNQHEIFVENYSNKVPLGRMGTPKDIAPAVSFLLSPEAKYITGHNLIVDGGWTCI